MSKTLTVDEATGSYDCVQLIVAPQVPSSYDGELCLLRYLRRARVLPAAGTQFNVPSGAGPLVGAVIGHGDLSAVSVTVTDPSGNQLVATRSAARTDRMVFAREEDDANVASFAVMNPQEGSWNVQVSVTGPDAGEFYFAMYTTPTADAYETMVQTSEGLLDQQAVAALSRKLGVSAPSTSKCKTCRSIAAVAITLLVLAIIGLGASALTTSSVAVGVIAGLFAFSLVATLLWIQSKAKEYGTSGAYWLDGACRWAGYC